MKNTKRARKPKICPACRGPVKKVRTPFKSSKIDSKTNKRIIVKDTFYFVCTNKTCKRSWTPSAEIQRVENIIFARAWKLLPKDKIIEIRNALGFTTKTQASRFLGLNEKAFTKIEQGKGLDINFSTDLLIRLVAFSKANFDFVKHLHAKGMSYDPFDYELICTQKNLQWKYSYFNRFPNSDTPYSAIQSQDVEIKKATVLPKMLITSNDNNGGLYV